jgi:hypothetical protein
MSGLRDSGPFSKERAEERRIADKCFAEEHRLAEERRAEERRAAEERRLAKERFAAEERSKRWEEQGLCHYCGGKMGGLFTKRCKACGREK